MYSRLPPLWIVLRPFISVRDLPQPALFPPPLAPPLPPRPRTLPYFRRPHRHPCLRRHRPRHHSHRRFRSFRRDLKAPHLPPELHQHRPATARSTACDVVPPVPDPPPVVPAVPLAPAVVPAAPPVTPVPAAPLTPDVPPDFPPVPGAEPPVALPPLLVPPPLPARVHFDRTRCNERGGKQRHRRHQAFR